MPNLADIQGRSYTACLFTIMLATSGCFVSLRNLATLTVIVGALCRLADAANPTCKDGFDWVG
jgi:hypothetical protein